MNPDTWHLTRFFFKFFQPSNHSLATFQYIYTYLWHMYPISEIMYRARKVSSGSLLTHWPLGDLNVILKMQSSILVYFIGIFKSSYDNVLKWMPQDLTDDKSTLVQVMAWCRQATSNYLYQCWPRSPTPYGVTRSQWVNSSSGVIPCEILSTINVLQLN